MHSCRVHHQGRSSRPARVRPAARHSTAAGRALQGVDLDHGANVRLSAAGGINKLNDGFRTACAETHHPIGFPC